MALTWLPDLTGISVRKDGVAVAESRDLDFSGDAWTVTYAAATRRVQVAFSAASVQNSEGFEMPLLPQVDTSASSTNATQQTLATVSIADNTMYVFAVYCHAFAAAYASESVWEFDAIWRRHAGTGGIPAQLTSTVATSINPLAITGPSLVRVGNTVTLQWTGHATTPLRARVQMSYLHRPIVLP